jgi:hypothetical protein
VNGSKPKKKANGKPAVREAEDISSDSDIPEMTSGSQKKKTKRKVKKEGPLLDSATPKKKRKKSATSRKDEHADSQPPRASRNGFNETVSTEIYL